MLKKVYYERKVCMILAIFESSLKPLYLLYFFNQIDVHNKHHFIQLIHHHGLYSLSSLTWINDGAVMFFHSLTKVLYILLVSYLVAMLQAFGGEIDKGGNILTNHTKEVQLVYVRVYFIYCIRDMFFFSFFWAYFHSS